MVSDAQSYRKVRVEAEPTDSQPEISWDSNMTPF